MYQEFFGLREAPFSIAPNPHYLYMSKQHHEALAHLVYGVGRDGGFVLLTGEVGTGKTTICRCFLEQIPPDTDVAFILNPKLNAEQLLATICDELGISYFDDDVSIKSLVDCINAYLLKSHSKGRHTVLIIDEAQNLSPEVLEQLRLLTNLETHEKKLLQIVLLGQPELQDMFLRPDLRQLAQRVTARFHLKELQPGEIGPYVRHRLGVAGGRDIISIFPEKTLKKLYAITAGVPRVINLVCDRAMLGAYAQNMRSVDVRTLERAAREILGPSYPAAMTTPRWLKPAFSPKALAVAVILGVAGGLFWIVQGIQINIAISPQNAPAAELAGKQAIERVSVAKLDTAADQKEASTGNDNSASIASHSSGAESGTGEIAGKIQRVSEHAAATADTAETVDESTAPLAAEIPVHDVLQPILQGFLQEETAADEMTAYRELFALWNVSSRAVTPAKACRELKRDNMQCLSRSGSLGLLRHLGLPAVVTLYAENGRKAFAVMRKLEGGNATLWIRDQEITISEEAFNQAWRGHFSLLWKAPEGYSGPLQPGAVSPMSRWLREGFARLDQTPAEAGSASYDAKLVARVKAFQREMGEVDDGIVGEATLILLARKLDKGLPLLSREEAP